jgi:proton-translocating NAD(P)+ transhydrogenase subunit alpha
MDAANGQTHTLTIGVLRERIRNERRVALLPDSVAELTAVGLSVVVELGAGEAAYFADDAYVSAGAQIEASDDEVYRQADILAKVQPPLLDEAERIRRGTWLVSFLDPARDSAIVDLLSEREVSAFSFNALPRTTRAQSMDAMSAMSTVAGYKAVLIAANALGRFFPMLMTAAGTVSPARVVVIGAGVAGLQALATARRLGARTAACDARPAVREQIESVGAVFIDMSVPVEQMEGEGGYARAGDEEIYRRERDSIREHIVAADVVITTAQVPGAPAPMLVDEAMVRDMAAGSVIVDLAAESGGNCELTVLGETVCQHGVTIVGPANLASTVPVHASQMLSRNVLNVVKYLVKDGEVRTDMEDEILRSACVTASVSRSS